MAVLSSTGMGASCTDGGIAPYSDGVFTGFFQTWTNCGGAATGSSPWRPARPTARLTVFLLIQLPTDDNTALQTIVSSFNFAGVGPGRHRRRADRLTLESGGTSTAPHRSMRGR